MTHMTFIRNHGEKMGRMVSEECANNRIDHYK